MAKQNKKEKPKNKNPVQGVFSANWTVVEILYANSFVLAVATFLFVIQNGKGRSSKTASKDIMPLKKIALMQGQRAARKMEEVD